MDQRAAMKAIFQMVAAQNKTLYDAAAHRLTALGATHAASAATARIITARFSACACGQLMDLKVPSCRFDLALLCSDARSPSLNYNMALL